MSESSTWSSFKTHWVMETPPVLILLIVSSYFLILFIFLYGKRELHRAKTYITRHCFVKSSYLTTKQGGRNTLYTPNWNITLIDDGDSYKSNNNQPSDTVITSLSSYHPESWALRVAKRKEIDQRYPCYGASGPEGWSWQWRKPSTMRAYIFISLALTFFIIVTGLIIVRYFYQTNLKSTTTQETTTPF
ncbi:unnamed protein product [Adineta steineri]|uniref:Uncharacterized protein n=1 Tax=Adineta steineri TaxID=433720 RepID=A0A819YMC1_9BILA|nr:unnamed protein product [Adineta steineri]CAF4151229.1 unnamed protein product [Adineta steineri]